MKRGLIAFDRATLSPAVFERRMDRVRAALAERDLPALLVYTDVWRSNQGRFLTNFMPYWNRSLIAIPRDTPPVLLCGLSPRVYPWIESVTVLEEIRPASKLTTSLDQLCAERAWSKLGVLDLPKLPMEIHNGLQKLEVVDVPSADVIEPDDAELTMRRRAALLARRILERELPAAAGDPDHHFVGRLEREYRRAGAEDLVIRINSRDAVPAPAKGSKLGDSYSAAIALEYSGHWVKVTRAQGSPEELATLHQNFQAALRGTGPRNATETLSGAQPYESGFGSTFALHVEHAGLYYGDTCVRGETL